MRPADPHLASHAAYSDVLSTLYADVLGKYHGATALGSLRNAPGSIESVTTRIHFSSAVAARLVRSRPAVNSIPTLRSTDPIHWAGSAPTRQLVPLSRLRNVPFRSLDSSEARKRTAFATA